MVKEDVVLHAHAQLFADVLDVGQHVAAVDLDGAGGRGEQAGQQGPERPRVQLV